MNKVRIHPNSKRVVDIGVAGGLTMTEKASAQPQIMHQVCRPTPAQYSGGMRWSLDSACLPAAKRECPVCCAGGMCCGKLLCARIRGSSEGARRRISRVGDAKNVLEIIVPVPTKTARTAQGRLRGDIARQDCRFAHKIAVSLSLYVISLPFVTPPHMKRDSCLSSSSFHPCSSLAGRQPIYLFQIEPTVFSSLTSITLVGIVNTRSPLERGSVGGTHRSLFRMADQFLLGDKSERLWLVQ